MNDIRKKKKIFEIAILFVWIRIIVVCFIHRDKITVDSLIQATPKSLLLAFFTFMFLFVLKSLSIVINSGIFYIAIGVIFPLPISIMVSICGSVLMFTTPYILGKRFGESTIAEIENKYPKTKVLSDFRDKNDFIFVLIARTIGVIPYDICSLYMGAMKVSYLKYIIASTINCLPRAILLTVLGESALNPNSSQFVITIICYAIFGIMSMLACYLVYRKEKASKNA